MSRRQEKAYLGVQDTSNDLLKIGILVDIDITETIGMAQNGDLGVVLNKLNQLLTPTRDDKVDELILLE
jgi:hypothetical protein